MKLPLLGSLDDITRVLDEQKVKTVYILTSMESSPELRKLYITLLDRSININWVPDIFTLNLINHNVKELGGVPVIAMSETPLRGRMLLIKSIEDRLLAGLALILLSPIMLVTALAIKLNSPGPVFFKQDRTGWDGRVFKIFKFRSMHVHPVESGVVKQATKDDPRVTEVGRFIRRTSIDELPQLMNVIVGDMSLVGPRPHAVQHNDFYSRKIHAYLARHRIKPGITGLAQVRGFRGETEDLDLMAERVTSDIEYINNWSLALDLSILFRTAFTLFDDRAY
jgi:putative colanic acid biosynthesis UDP-glucose lipid carrier transferase